MLRSFASRFVRLALTPALGLTFVTLACSSEDTDPPSSDDSTATGGTAGTGGTGGSPSANTGGAIDCPAHASGPECACDEGYVNLDARCVEEECSASSCNGHGVCDDEDIGITCRCDNGFEGPTCGDIASDFYARRLLVDGLADPDVYAENDDSFFLTGTAPSARTLPIYHSTDLVTFDEHTVYDPSAVDPDYDYCHVWAPDLTKYDGVYDLYFSAHRVPNGSACPPPSGQTVTTFHVSAPSLEFEFGAPTLLNNGANLPASRIQNGCLPSGCADTIRIDAAAYDDGTNRWFFYVWFDGGNNIAGYRYSDPASLILNAGPKVFTIPAHEELINEAPDVFFRNGHYYFFFSGGFFDSQYAMYYVMADDVASLTRARTVRRHSIPLENAAGHLVESHGHNSIAERRGEFFNFFHQGAFNASGNLTRRSTYVQRIAFAEDDSIVALNYVDLRWSRVPGASYSLDVVTRDGTVVGPCLSAGRLGTSTSTRFSGICPSHGDVVVNKSDIAAFRLYSSTDGTWSQFVDVPYDGIADRVFVPVPGGTTESVALRWSELDTGRNYSLDVRRADGSWIAPCLGAGTLGSRTEQTFDGSCISAAETIAPSEIQAFRVCSAVGNDWANARCGTTVYDGSAGFVDVRIP